MDFILVKAGLCDISKIPALVLEFPAFCIIDTPQPELRIEFINVDVEQLGIGQHFFDIDETIAIFNPQTRTKLLCYNRIGGLDAHALCGFFAVRSDQLTHNKSKNGKDQARSQQCHCNAGDGYATDAQYNKFRMSCELT